MMRKDVKLGFAIGGVLLAVLVVYVLVGTGSNSGDHGGAGIVTEEPSGANSTAGVIKRDAPHDSRGRDEEVSATASTDKPARDTPLSQAIESSPPSTAPAVAANGAGTGLATDAIASAAVGKSPAAHDANGDLWDRTLSSGELMMSHTPAPADPNINTNNPTNVPGGGVDRREDAPSARNTMSRASGPTTLTRSDADDRSSGASTPSTAASSPGNWRGTTHIVQKDETLALISKAVYGSPNYYPHILRANPGLDPKKLKPGMTINIPAVGDVKPDGKTDGKTDAGGTTATAGAAPEATAVDSRTQYRVEQNDTLERIAIKLYGKREMVEKIYELNKRSLPDRNKLKLHQILQLPEPPTQTASR